MNVFQHTQHAVEAAQVSQHEHSKVGACLVASDNSWHFAHPNFYPPAIVSALGTDTRIGNASATVHAETACLLQAPHAAKGGAMFSTDPSCPNCVKNMIAAGVSTLYIDHKGFEKYFAKKRMTDFETLSLPLCHAAGIGVYKVWRKDEKIEPLIEQPPHRLHDVQPPPPDGGRTIGANATIRWGGIKFTPLSHYAQCNVGDETLTMNAAIIDGTNIKSTDHSKYSLCLQPLTRLLMHCAGEGLKPDKGSFISSRVPTCREMVNFIGSGYSALTIINKDQARDEESFAALEMLKETLRINIDNNPDA